MDDNWDKVFSTYKAFSFNPNCNKTTIEHRLSRLPIKLSDPFIYTISVRALLRLQCLTLA